MFLKKEGQENEFSCFGVIMIEERVSAVNTNEIILSSYTTPWFLLG